MMLAKDARQKEERLLLEAIGKVRSQKQRPNVERIFAMMQQSCEGLTVDDVARQLESAVKSRKIVCFESKGGVSYRDASLQKSSKTELSKQQRSEDDGREARDLSSLVISSVKRSTSGCTLEEIMVFVRNSLSSLDNRDTDTLRQQLDVICRKLVSDKSLVMRGGLYVLYEFVKSKSPLRTFSADSVDGDDRLSSTTSSSLKKLPSRKSVCLICRRQQDDTGCTSLVTCSDCNYAGHASCIKLSPSLARTVRSTQWQCYACKTCSACKGSGNSITMPADLLICDGCDRGFHVECCKPPTLAQRASSGRWLCSNCSSDTVMADADPYQYASDSDQRRRGDSSAGNTYRHGSLPKSKKELHSDASEAVVGSSSDVAKSRPRRASGDCAATSSSRQSSESSSPHSDSTHCDNIVNKSSSGVPRGLVDALSQYFTPSDKRRSRVSLNALPLHVVIGQDAETDVPVNSGSVDADTTRRDEVVVRSPVPPASRSPLRNWKKARHLPGSYQTGSYCSNSSNSSVAMSSPCRQLSDLDAEPTNSCNDRDRTDPEKLHGNLPVIDASVSNVSKFTGVKVKQNKDSSSAFSSMPQSLVQMRRLSGGFSLPYKEIDKQEEITLKGSKRKSVGSHEFSKNTEVESRCRSSSLSETESDSRKKRFRRTQLSSLQDSLSHLFSADGERKRSARSAEYTFASLMFAEQMPSKKIRKNRSLSDSRRRELDQEAERSIETDSCSSLFKPSGAGDSLPGSCIGSQNHPSVSEPNIQDDDVTVFKSSQGASQVSSSDGDIHSSSPVLKSRLIPVVFGNHRWNVNISANCIADTASVGSISESDEKHSLPWMESVLHMNPTLARFHSMLICERCMKVYGSDRAMLRHARKCTTIHQNVGTEIYRCGDLSVYEVDGSVESLYSLGLSLLISMFGVDSKMTVDTAVCDVTAQACLFYVLVNNSKGKCSMLGFLSKEVNYQQKSSLSKLLIFPEHRGKGFDVFLVELNYKLCHLEGISCSYAQPLPDSTRELLESYWSRVVVDYLALHLQKSTEITICDVSAATGISAEDVTATLKSLSLISGPIVRENVLINRNRITDLSGLKRMSYSVRFDPSLVRLVPRNATATYSCVEAHSSRDKKTMRLENDGYRDNQKQDSTKHIASIQSVPPRRKVGRPKGSFKRMPKQLLLEKNGPKRGRGRPPKVKGSSQVSHKFGNKKSSLAKRGSKISGRGKTKNKPSTKMMPRLAASEMKVSYPAGMPKLKRRDQSVSSSSDSEELDRSPSPPTLEQVDIPCSKKDDAESASQDSCVIEVADILEPVSRICDNVILEHIGASIDEKVSIDGSLSLDKSDIEDLETANRSNFDSFDDELNESENVDSDSDDDDDGSTRPMKTVQVGDDVFMGNSPSSSSNALEKKVDVVSPRLVGNDKAMSDDDDESDSCRKESTKNSSVSDADDLDTTMTEKLLKDNGHHSSRASSPALSSSYESDAGSSIPDEEDTFKPVEDNASVDEISKVQLSETDSIDRVVILKDAEESADSDMVDMEFEDQVGSTNPVEVDALAESSESGGFPSDFVKKLTSSDGDAILMPDLGFENMVKDKDGKSFSAEIVDVKNISEDASPVPVTTDKVPIDADASDSLSVANSIVQTSSDMMSSTQEHATITARTTIDGTIDYQLTQEMRNDETLKSLPCHSTQSNKMGNSKTDSAMMTPSGLMTPSGVEAFCGAQPSFVREVEQIASCRESFRSALHSTVVGNERGPMTGQSSLGQFLPGANSMNIERNTQQVPSYITSEHDRRNAVGIQQQQLSYPTMVSSPGRNNSAPINTLHNSMSNVPSPGGSGVVRGFGGSATSEQNSYVHNSAAYRNLSGQPQHSAHHQTSSPASSASELAMPSPKNYYMDFNMPRLGGYTGQPTSLSVSDAGFAGPRAQSAKGSPGSCGEAAVASPAGSILSPVASSGGRAHFNMAPVTSRSPASRIDQSPTSVSGSAYGSIPGGSVAPGSRQPSFSRPNPSPSSTSHPSKRNSGGGVGGTNRPNQSPLEINVFSPTSAVESSQAMHNASCMAVPPSCATPDVGLSFHFPSNNVVAVPVTATSYASIPSPTPRSLQLLLPSVSTGSSVGGSSGYQRQGQQHHASTPQSAVPVHQRSASSSSQYQSQHHQPSSTGLGLLGYGGMHGAPLPQVSYAAAQMLDQRFMPGAVPYDQPSNTSSSFPGGRQGRNQRSAHVPGQPLARLQQLTNQLNESELIGHYDMPPYAMSGGPTMSMLLGQGVGPGHGGGLQESFLSGIPMNSGSTPSVAGGQQPSGKSTGRRRAAGATSTTSKANVSQNGGVQAPLPFSPNIAAAAGYNMLGAFQHSQQPHGHQQARPPSRFDYQQYLAANAAAAAAGFFNTGASQLPMQMMHFGMQHPQVATPSATSSFTQSQALQRTQGGNPMYPAYGYGSLPSSDHFNNSSGR